MLQLLCLQLRVPSIVNINVVFLFKRLQIHRPLVRWFLRRGRQRLNLFTSLWLGFCMSTWLLILYAQSMWSISHAWLVRTLTDGSLEILKSNHNYCHIIKWFSVKTVLQNSFYSKSAVLMNSKLFRFTQFGSRLISRKRSRATLFTILVLIGCCTTHLYTFAIFFVG